MSNKYIMSEELSWKPYGKTWLEFEMEKLASPGVLVVFDTGKEILIGDVNENGGVCSDCLLDEIEWPTKSIVKKYTILIRREGDK